MKVAYFEISGGKFSNLRNFVLSAFKIVPKN